MGLFRQSLWSQADRRGGIEAGHRTDAESYRQPGATNQTRKGPDASLRPAEPAHTAADRQRDWNQSSSPLQQLGRATGNGYLYQVDRLHGAYVGPGGQLKMMNLYQDTEALDETLEGERLP